MKGDDKPTANPVVILREEFDDWAILFDPDTGRGFGLSPTAIRLWKLLDGQHTLGTLLQKICHDTDSVPGDAADQITVFIDELVAHGLAGFSETVFGSVNRPFAPEAPRGVKPFPYTNHRSSSISSRIALRRVSATTAARTTAPVT